MPAEIDTLQLLGHLDSKFAEADRKRTASLEAVHAKIDENAREARHTLGEFRRETTAAFGRIDTTLGTHDLRIKGIECRETAAAAKTESRMLTAAKILLSGGGLAALWEFLRTKGS